jgi:hypothetical protein
MKMKMMEKLITVCVMVMLMGMGTLAQATLIDRGADTLGNHLIYDTDRNITWYDYSKIDDWGTQMSWAENLTVTMADGRSFTDWRLPTAGNQDGSGPDWGYNSTGSEMGHLYYTELGNVAGGPLTNTGPFTNLLPNIYWSSTDRYSDAREAWNFRFDYGLQTTYDKPTGSYALAVHPGDVVPEPATICMLGLGALSLIRRKK